MKKRLLFVSLFLIHFLFFIFHFPFLTCSQEISTDSKKAGKFFFNALDAYQSRQYELALREVDVALREDPRFFEAWILRGDIQSDNKRYPEAIDAYRKALDLKPDQSSKLCLILGDLELMTGRYVQARSDFERFLAFDRIPADKRTRAEKSIKACDFALDLMAHPVPFDPVNLGDSINSQFDEYINTLSSDGQQILFTRKQPSDSLTVDRSSRYEEDFFFALFTDSGWSAARELGPPINTHGNEGAVSISPDGQRLFFAACHRDDGHGSCDIYMSKRSGNRWSSPQNLGTAVNSAAWESQPSFSSDGKTLYFASKRPGGKGSSDIWCARLQPDGSWSSPENLGDSVNTSAEEMSPYIHTDDQTLYFSSRGLPGLGGLDLFLVRKDSNGRWHKPVNLGYPINSYADEITLLINTRGDLAYISSDKLGGKGRQDIYSFPLYLDARPIPATYLKGVVYDNETRRRLDARFELTDLTTGREVAESVSDPVSGEFLLVLPADREYALNVSRSGYLFYSDHFSLSGTSSIEKPFLKDIPLKPIQVGETVILKNIFFDTDKYELKPASLVELNRLKELLVANPDIRMEISGHTDNQGTAQHNLELSRERAKAVFDFLVQHGIPASRLTFEGYGLNRPVDTNDTPEGRANNRRTEFRIAGI